MIMSMTYLDNAATTFPKPKEVYEYMNYMYQNHGMNIGRGINSSLEDVNSLVEKTRIMLKELVQANDSYEAVFAASATIALNQILWGLNWDEIKNVYVSYFEHNSVLRTLEAIKKEKGINIIFLDFNSEKWEYDFEKISYKFQNEIPHLIILNHVSNVFGYISPIEEIHKVSKQCNPIYIIDGSQSVGLIDINLKKNDFDFVVFAGHKTLYASFGIAGFIMKKEVNLKPYIYGGTGTESANMDMPNEGPTRYEAGSMNILGIFGLYKALLWINEIGVNNIRLKKEILTENLKNVLEKYDFIKSYIPTNNHTSIISFRIKNYPVDSMGEAISNNYNIALRHGLHCAPFAHKITNTLPEGTIRVSLGYFTSNEDIEKLDKALSDLEYEI